MTRIGEHLGWDARYIATSQIPGTVHQSERILTVSSVWQRWVTPLMTPPEWLGTLVTLTEHREIEETPSIVAEIVSLLDRLQQLGVRLGKQGEIRDYLLQFPELIEVIPLAVRATLNHLPKAQLFLKVYRDPEIEDQYLVLYVRVQRYDESVMERIEAAEREYIDLLIGKEGWLQLSTDFREPEFTRWPLIGENS